MMMTGGWLGREGKRRKGNGSFGIVVMGFLCGLGISMAIDFSPEENEWT